MYIVVLFCLADVPVPQPLPDPIQWIHSSPHTAQSLAHRAVVAGKEGWDSSPLWVIRAHHSGDLIPGKLAIKHRHGFIPFAGQELTVHNFEVNFLSGHYRFTCMTTIFKKYRYIYLSSII